ncbi:MAG: metalloregulator ArsR/SmtB family transcription factor [Anaerolineae bacterium]
MGTIELTICDQYVTIISHMVDDVSIWAALADSKRRQIVNLLEEKPRTTSDLSEFFDVSRFAVMKHLNVLEQAKLIKVRREGRKRWNILNDDLAHFLRTKLVDDDNGPYRLVDVLGLLPGSVPAAIAASPPANPLHVKQDILLQASPSQVFEAFTVGIDAWWCQRVSAGSQMYLEPYVNGRFYEAFNTTGQGMLYGTVTTIKQDEEMRLKGSAELAEQFTSTFATDNFIHITLKKQENATQLILSHHFIGNFDAATQNNCQEHWHTLLDQHLKPFIEEGIPYQHNP